MRMWIWIEKSVDAAALWKLLGRVCNQHSRTPLPKAL
jgi:hypothetical protein